MPREPARHFRKTALGVTRRLGPASLFARYKRADLTQGFTGDLGNEGVFSRMANHEKNKWLFVRGTAEDFVQKSHRTRGVRQRHQAAQMQCGHEYSGRDSDRFKGIVGRGASSIGEEAKRLCEHGDQPGRGFEKRFVRIRPQRSERLQPRFWGAMLVE